MAARTKTRAPAPAATDSPRRIEYTPLEDVLETEGNPKDHDLPKVIVSICRLGYTEPVLLDERTGRLIAGNGRTLAVKALHAHQTGDAAALDRLGVNIPAKVWSQVDALLADNSPPDGISLDDDGRWLIPVVRGWASANDQEARTAVVAANKLAEAGGWNDRQLAEWLDDIASTTPDLLDATGYDTAALDDLLRETSALSSRAEEYFRDYQDTRPDEADQAPAAVFSHTEPPASTPAPAAPPTPTPASSPGTQPAAERPAPPPQPPVPQPGEQTAEPEEPGPVYVSVSWSVTTSERETIRRALNSLQKELELPTSAAALVALAERRLNTGQGDPS